MNYTEISVDYRNFMLSLFLLMDTVTIHHFLLNIINLSINITGIPIEFTFSRKLLDF